jgi:HEAT repeat protein
LKAAFARGEALNALLRAWAGNLVLDAIADAGTHLETRLAAAREALGWPEGKSWLVTHSRALPVEVQALLRGSGGEAKGEVDAAKLMATLGDKSATRVTRSAAARGLAKSDTPEVRKALLGALADREGTVRAAAAESLASLGPGAGVFYKVLPLVGDRDPDVRRAGVVLVAKSDGKRGLAELGPRCRREKDRAVVRSCATAFGLIAEEGARVELVRLTKAEDAEVARAAWIALAGKRERDPQAAALVATRVGDQDPVVRALAMAATGDEAALVAGLRDPDLAVRKAALRGLLRKARPAGIEQALDIVAGSTSVDERWWVGAVLLEAL